MDKAPDYSARMALLEAEREAFRAELARRIEAFDLARNITELEFSGYTVVRDVAPPEFFADLRQAILDVNQASRAKHNDGDRRGLFSSTVKNTLTKGRIFEQTALNAKVNTLMAYLLGDGYVLNTQSATIVSQGTPSLFIHTDNAFAPEPFPPWALTATAVWVSEDLDEATGSTRVVPGSHRYARHPRPGEGEESAIPIICPAGSVQIWNGATWHGNCGRTAPGERVTLHTSYTRMILRPFANNDIVPQEVIDRNPGMAQLLGRGLPFGMEYDNGSDPELMAHAHRLGLRRV